MNNSDFKKIIENYYTTVNSHLNFDLQSIKVYPSSNIKPNERGIIVYKFPLININCIKNENVTLNIEEQVNPIYIASLPKGYNGPIHQLDNDNIYTGPDETSMNNSRMFYTVTIFLNISQSNQFSIHLLKSDNLVVNLPTQKVTDSFSYTVLYSIDAVVSN